MKWFKHFSDAHSDTRIKRIIRKYGLKGYGLYFACVEMIANQLEPESPIPELEDNARDIAEMFGEDTLLVEEMLSFMIHDQRLFELNEENGRLMCLKLLAHLDNTLSSNPQIKQIISNFKKLEETSSDLNKLNTDQIRSDQIRSDQIRSDNNTCVIDPEFLNFWTIYDKKLNQKQCIKLWSKLTKAEKETIAIHLPLYVKSTPDKQYRKHPSSYLNQKAFNDEIVQSFSKAEKKSIEVYNNVQNAHNLF